jgi:hydrogenase maturation protein HypF
LKTFHLHIEGRVQGVGFRPFVYGLANEMSIPGTVANTLEGVHIYINASEKQAAKFKNQILRHAPGQALITSCNSKEVAEQSFDGFEIIDSGTEGIPDLLITPDFAICDACRKELLDPNNRRYSYPYITCTVCGPRFSIENGLPYDRHCTSMHTFKMCPQCEAEYQNPTDRRFYSQTNTCPDCQVSQWVTDDQGRQLDIQGAEVVNYICEKIRTGSVAAIKGIGGFLLMCDAENTERVLQLRSAKDRPTKPFAMMFPDVASVQEHFHVSQEELTELQSSMAPIVLLRPKQRGSIKNLTDHIAPELDRFGVMLPYTPLFVLMMQKLQKPLLATSGNIKGSPISYKNEEALASLAGFTDYFLLNNREIQIPQDDSVIKFSSKHHQKIVIRRSRGYAPGYLQEAIEPNFDERLLAMGALLKSTFAIWQNGRCHISQFLGDSTELDAQVSFERTLKHFRSLLHFTPEMILLDKHPAYFSTQMGKELAHAIGAKTEFIQHHEAHFWAVLGENKLIREPEKVLGVVLDGTGMGNDGAIWGGEFFVFQKGQIHRANHIQYYPHILGDKMAREPRLAALAILHASACGEDLSQELFSGQELDFYHKVLDHSSLSTSSMGRIFDAVASILGLCHINSYEGEAAMYLEKVAQEFCDKAGSFPSGYDAEISARGSINLCPAIKAILGDRKLGKETGLIAARFHRTVVDVIEKIANSGDVKKIAFSGGVMQNGLLVDMIIDQLEPKYTLYFHEELSPNDECISFGQLVGYYASVKTAAQKRDVVQLKSGT